MPLGWSEDIIAVEPRAFAPDHASGNGSIPARLVDRQNRRSGTRSKRVQDLLLQYALAGNLNGPRRRTDPHRGRVCCRIRALLDLWLLMHLVSTASTYARLINPWGTGAQLLFWAAIPVLAAMLTLFLLREQDRLLSIDAARERV